jgi:hypothetical protein
VLQGAGFTVTVAPATEAPFEATSGPQAGKYTADNVNVTFVGFPGGDGSSYINFRVSRAE